MTDIKRQPRRRQPTSEYATLAEARRNRRDFLRLLGRGLVAVPLASIAAACGVGKEQHYELNGVQRVPEDALEETRGPDAVASPDYELAGGAPFEPQPDVIGEPDYQIAGDEMAVDLHEQADFVSPGGPAEIDEQPDVKEPDWGLAGIIDEPDLQSHQEDIQEEDYTLSGGIGEPPPE
jgi:hypothetical protein